MHSPSRHGKRCRPSRPGELRSPSDHSDKSISKLQRPCHPFAKFEEHAMPDQHPQDQPGQKPQQDWHEVSAQEIEQTLSSAADLAHELAGDVGVTGAEPRFRDTAGLESIETALDVELKQLEHLVSRTKEELSEGPPRAGEVSPRTSSIPDFMSEFLTDEPVTIMPESRAFSASEGEHKSPALPLSHRRSDDIMERREQASETARPGLIGVASLGRLESKKSKRAEKSKSEPQTPSSPRTSFREVFEKPVYAACDAAIRVLEMMDRPFSKLSPASRRGLSVTALAAFCVCLLLFLMTVLFS